ncbi:Rv3235 family protein [Antrihabitans stalactiti]|uniref:Uncharacterized protein n=1 Tax=Antrihabitans stalactiti TaxID=2584121 RepID=A0A848KCK5_9NOCA|nr:Rv3235 family protein [Antrihabitans stalactiti]NMN96049.1 hypothetical protein [Antrihabitans stalactiti]
MNRARSYLSRAPHCEPPLAEALDTAADAPSGRCLPQLTHSTRRSPHSGRSPGTTAVSKRELPITAKRFAETVFRLALEVVDRRRSPAQLRTVLDPALVDMLRTLSTAALPGRDLGAATLGHVHLKTIDAGNAEVFGTYNRGPRVFAIAGKVRLHNGSWQVTSLRIV